MEARHGAEVSQWRPRGGRPIRYNTPVKRTTPRILAAVCAAGLLAGPVRAATPTPAVSPAAPTAASAADPTASILPGRTEVAPDALQGIGVDEKLGNPVPLDLSFRNEEGEVVKLGDYFGKGRPVVLQLAYFECPMLCSLVAEGMTQSLKGVDLKKSGDFDILTVSIDPRETPSMAKAKRTTLLRDLGKPAGAEGVHFLVGDERNIKLLADAVGWKFKYIPSVGQFSHPAAIMVMTPQGKVGTYLYGVRFDSARLTDSIANAQQEKTTTPLQAFILTCFHVGSSIAKYTTSAYMMMRIAGVLTMLTIVGTVTAFIVRDNRRRAADEVAEGAAE